MEDKRLDKVTGQSKLKDLNKSELVRRLKQAGITDPRGTKAKLQDKCKEMGIPIQADVPVVLEGWVGKSKGALQILYERGWIDPLKIHLYTGDGRVNDDGAVEYSIRQLMKQQTDFVQEVTLLQYHAQKLGTTLDRSPKCHPEIAGEGIEYVWALSKMNYRRAPISEKRNRAKFRQLVHVSTSPMTVLNINRVRACSRRARTYMKMYSIVQSLSKDEQIIIKNHSVLEETVSTYRKMKRVGKTHRSVFDMNKKDVNEIENVNPLTSTPGDKRIKMELIDLIVNKMNCM